MIIFYLFSYTIKSIVKYIIYCFFITNHNFIQARYLPCELPEFYIRLTPDYLQTGQLNWYYLPKLKFLSSLNNPNKDNVNHLENSERYLNLYYDELNKQFDRMKQLTDHRKSLVKIGKTWVSVNLFVIVLFRPTTLGGGVRLLVM